MASDIREKVKQFVLKMVHAFNTREMYGAGHKLTNEAVSELYALLSEILLEEGSLTIGIVGDEVAFQKEPFYEISKGIKTFIERLKSAKAEKISFSRGVTKDEVDEFFLIISNLRKLSNIDDYESVFGRPNITHIVIGELGLEKEEKQEEADFDEAVKKTYEEGSAYLEETIDNIKENKPIDVSTARKIISGITTNLLRNKDLLKILTSTRSHDESTFVHEINVAIFTMLQAEALGIDKSYFNEIGVAALLHDAGKMAVSGSIIRKPGKLTDEEMGEISLHPVNGAKILLDLEGVPVLAAISAFEHHVRYDKSGYPKKIFGDKLNLISMMTTIADFYDAVRSERSYAESFSPEKTYKEMIELKGKFFHPDLLDNFFSIIGVYTPGTLVELDTKETGIVVKESSLDVERPWVEVLYNKKGEKIKKPFTVNLLEEDEKGSYKRTIVRSIAPSDKFSA